MSIGFCVFDIFIYIFLIIIKNTPNIMSKIRGTVQYATRAFFFTKISFNDYRYNRRTFHPTAFQFRIYLQAPLSKMFPHFQITRENSVSRPYRIDTSLNIFLFIMCRYHYRKMCFHSSPSYLIKLN